MYGAHRILDGDELNAAGLVVAFRTPKGGQDERSFAGDHMRPVQFGRDVYRQGNVAHCGLGHRRVRSRAREVAAHREEHANSAVAHCPDGIDGVDAGLSGRVERKLRLERIEKARRWALPNAHGAVALDVRVAAYGTHSSARPANVAAKEQEVGNLPDGRYG